MRAPLGSVASWAVALLRRPGDELWVICSDAKQRWRAGERPVLAVIAGLLCVLCTSIYSVHRLRPALEHLGAVRAALPLGTEVSRMPLSAFLPTPELPLVAAVLQVVVVLGLAELLLGRVMTVTLALAAHITSTLLARLLIELGSATVLGLPHTQALLLDTGPSVMTTAVGARLLVAHRAHWSLAMLCGGLLLAAGLQNNIDGREHLAALVLGLALPPLALLARSAAYRIGLPVIASGRLGSRLAASGRRSA
jgi:hypothetical protein